MKVVFWQNIISPHQVEFLGSFSKLNEVELIVEKEIDNFRRRQHWSINTPKGLNVSTSLTLKEVFSTLLRERKSIHVFSGFLSYPTISIALLIAILFKRDVYIISEAARANGLKGKVKLLIKKNLSSILKKRISGIFVTGNLAYEYFKDLGFSVTQLFQFGYFVDVKEDVKSPVNTVSSNKHLIYVGRLVAYKGVRELIKAFALIESQDSEYKLDLIGNGELESELKILSSELKIKNISFIKDIPRDDVVMRISNASLLLLPNIDIEGWGVVINESLLVGTPVVCSRYTGSNVLIEEPNQGIVLDLVDEYTIKEAVFSIVNDNRQNIVNSTKQRFSTESVAKYFDEIIKSNSSDKSPWVKK